MTERYLYFVLDACLIHIAPRKTERLTTLSKPYTATKKSVTDLKKMYMKAQYKWTLRLRGPEYPLFRQAVSEWWGITPTDSMRSDLWIVHPMSSLMPITHSNPVLGF